mmetsp:Transcript_29718/g.45313  ORF Transcript_29718/g.45313 Transcript_29718/m.45313 type:complete len:104 (-) Transcript_29718:60-371(-)|eukprot:CAMPEP_0170494160 /NCGR_PEP_ID=MMETSP0208-20121228/14482_1 /TAXON_ID=197538 /ORGANISM="Strombidium inclinatum, Strain S3" /LENGTH=103 /DNA_ID=CAMNT_0010770175 /DNA_START=13 /DNA_END=324 /DNA_ORIENTATION=-
MPDNHKYVTKFDEADFNSIIQNNKYVVFNATYCPFCMRTLQTLSSKGKQAYVVNVDKLNNEIEARQFLNAKAGMSTYPKNYINGKLIGGNQELQNFAARGGLN